MKCGETIFIKDINGAYAARFIAQCEGRFMVIADPARSYMNGYLVSDWKAVLRELIAMTVPAKMVERRMIAESTAGGRYADVPLTYPLSVKGIADLFGVDADEVRAQLADLAVQADA